tara:strand:- start:267 stop:800 length:534 start_codon:yes stop_codon:yes gene_type:complete
MYKTISTVNNSMCLKINGINDCCTGASLVMLILYWFNNKAEYSQPSIKKVISLIQELQRVHADDYLLSDNDSNTALLTKDSQTKYGITTQFIDCSSASEILKQLPDLFFILLDLSNGFHSISGARSGNHLRYFIPNKDNIVHRKSNIFPPPETFRESGCNGYSVFGVTLNKNYFDYM